MEDTILVNVQQKQHQSIITCNVRHDYNLEKQRTEIQRIINVHFNILKTALHNQQTDLTPIPPSEAGTTVTVHAANRTTPEEEARYRTILKQHVENNSMAVTFVDKPKRKNRERQTWTLKE